MPNNKLFVVKLFVSPFGRKMFDLYFLLCTVTIFYALNTLYILEIAVLIIDRTRF